ncbi:MAG: ferrochelatase [Sporichthyaceae bacterium]|nr:ferrochelatase [Sporichthyaceae bacterium]
MAQADYDAFLLASFGGPEGPDEVLPFLQHVTRGRGIPPERLVEVGAHYHRFGGISPINRQNRELKAAIEADFADAGLDLPVYLGNRHAPPFFADALAAMAADGRTSALVLLTSAYPSYSGCRAYREDLAAAVAEVGERAPRLARLPHYFDRQGFVEPFVDATVRAIAELPEPERAGAPLVFTTHSVPTSMADTAGPTGGGYVGAHEQVAARVAAAVAERVGKRDYRLVYQSRSGPPGQPWLEPDVCDHLDELAGAGSTGAVLVPIGFVSDHMEVLFDLDVQARERAGQLGLALTRATTPGTDPRFVRMVRELVREQLDSAGPGPARCAATCCPNPRGSRPTIGAIQVDSDPGRR